MIDATRKVERTSPGHLVFHFLSFTTTQEREVDANAARVRAVDRLVSGRREMAEADGAREEMNSRRHDVFDSEDESDAVNHMPVADAADLEPEEPPPPVRLEFQTPVKAVCPDAIDHTCVLLESPPRVAVIQSKGVIWNAVRPFFIIN